MHQSKPSLDTRKIQQRVLRNDGLMLDCATKILAQDGWGNLTLTAVSREMKLSSKPVRDRVRNSSQLAALVWNQRVADELLARFVRVVDSIDASPAEFAQAVTGLLSPSVNLNAGAELLIVSRFDNAIAVALESSFSAPLRSHISRDAASDITIAKRNYAVMLALGLWLSARYERAQTPNITQALELWYGAINSASKSVTLPEVCATHMDDEPLLVPDDEQLNKLLNTMLVNVGKYGFEATTTAKIAKHSGLSEGYLFNRYKSKMDLFVAATALQHDAGFQLNQDFFTAIESKYGIGIAEAVGIREAQLPHRDLARTMLLEQLRVGWHFAPLLARAELAHDTFRAQLLQIPGYDKRESEAEFFINVALSIGVAAMPIIDPDSAKYPYVAVTLPLYARIEAR